MGQLQLQQVQLQLFSGGLVALLTRTLGGTMAFWLPPQVAQCHQSEAGPPSVALGGTVPPWGSVGTGSLPVAKSGY